MKLFVVLLSTAVLAYGAHIRQEDPERIYGGHVADEGQFPHQVSIRVGEGRSHICGGSILNHEFVLSAAHCFQNYDPENHNDWIIIVGSNHLSHSGVPYYIQEVYIHEDAHYNSRKVVRFNDIALMKIAPRITMTDVIKPIEMNTEYVDDVEDVVVSGWGLTPSGYPEDLMYINLKTTTHELCARSMGGEALVPTSTICTLTKKGEGVCMGDSGGPLLWKGKLAGIPSYVVPCGVGYPDVYTRVSNFTNWVYRKMEEHASR